MNLEDKNITELKAICYDLIGQLEQTQKNIQTVNALIAKKYEEEKSKELPTFVKDDTSES